VLKVIFSETIKNFMHCILIEYVFPVVFNPYTLQKFSYFKKFL